MNALSTNTETDIILAGAPAIAGLRFRHFAGEADIPTLAALMNELWKSSGIDRVISDQTLRSDYRVTEQFDPAQDVLIAEVEGVMAGFGRMGWWNEQAEPNLFLFSMGGILPAWQRQGLGRAMLHYHQARLLEKAAVLEARFPRPAWRYFFDSFSYNTQPGNQALLESEGYQAVRVGHTMVCTDLANIPDLPLPAGLEVRPARPEQYRQIWDASQEAFQDHWGYSAPDEGDFQSWLTSDEFQPELWQVAWDGDQVAGMVLNFINPHSNEVYGRKRGWTEGISVRRPWRRKGLARALLARSMRMHRDLGMTETALGVDSENPNGAFGLYQSMGYRIIRSAKTYRKAL